MSVGIEEIQAYVPQSRCLPALAAARRGTEKLTQARRAGDGGDAAVRGRRDAGGDGGVALSPRGGRRPRIGSSSSRRRPASTTQAGRHLRARLAGIGPHCRVYE
jgi:hypothetical protein